MSRKKKIIVLILCCMLTCLTGCGKNADNGGTISQGSVTQPDASAQPSAWPQEPKDAYPYDIAADKADFSFSAIDIVVGDKLYMTQINDWYTNFGDYADKTVEIEGYYMVFDRYTYVGRKGPSCPYCTGGYVNFEFQSNDDLSAFVSESTWIKVTGILRQGTMYPGYGEAPQPFYYIEAMRVEKQDELGIDTVTD